jgi:hypothetical protein
MSKIVLRCRLPNSQLKIDNVTQETTLKELKQIIEQNSKIPPRQQKIKIGYPPKELKTEGNENKKLSELNIKSGETLIIEESEEIQISSKPKPEHYKGLFFKFLNSL